MKLEEALRQLPAACKTKRLRTLWPIIEGRLAEGVPHAEVLRLLNQSGFELKEHTYKTYLYRHRKKQRVQASAGREQTPATGTGATPLPTAAATGGSRGSKRPPTFDYDPHGIPDLLK